MSDINTYTVIIYYREPMYELYHGSKIEPYKAAYEVAAPSEDEAKASAIKQFNDTAIKSRVRWSRVIVDVVVSIKQPPVSGP